MLPTPNTDHIDPNTTYAPAEDSYLVLDTLTSDAPFLHDRFRTATTPPPLILELGTGSGIISAFIASNPLALFGRQDLHLLGTDANALACVATAKTLSLTPSKRFMGALVADLFTPIRPGVVDVLVFNPPYVPTPELPSLEVERDASKWDEESRLLALTYAGGLDGMEVTRRVLDGMAEVLSKRGVAYVLLCRSNRPEEVVAGLQRERWMCEKVGGSGKRGGIEKLEVWRIWR